MPGSHTLPVCAPQRHSALNPLCPKYHSPSCRALGSKHWNPLPKDIQAHTASLVHSSPGSRLGWTKRGLSQSTKGLVLAAAKNQEPTTHSSHGRTWGVRCLLSRFEALFAADTTYPLVSGAAEPRARSQVSSLTPSLQKHSALTYYLSFLTLLSV